MTIITECTHGMPTPASCFECMEDGPVAPPTRNVPETVDGPAFAANWPGECPGCDRPIVVGQTIRATSRGRYVHQGCTP